jgi:hypothetical protein
VSAAFFVCRQYALTGKDHSHRRLWIEERLPYLTPAFTLDARAYPLPSGNLEQPHKLGLVMFGQQILQGMLV